MKVHPGEQESAATEKEETRQSFSFTFMDSAIAEAGRMTLSAEMTHLHEEPKIRALLEVARELS